MDDVVTPSFSTWLYYNGSIIAVAVLAACIIVLVTRSNITAMATAAGRALSQAEARSPAHVQDRPSFVTMASARMRVSDDLFLLRVERRFHGPGGFEQARDALGACVQGLVDAGLDPDDVISEGVEVAEGDAANAVACVLARGPDKATPLVTAALKAGFREEKGRRRETFSLDDARDLLGRRAVERSRANAETLRGALDLAETFELIGAELETEADDVAGNTVTMRARSTWRLAA